MRLALAVAVFAAVASAVVLLVYSERRDARADIETDRRIEDARDACPDDLPWHERLLCARPR
jgi:hypothetical protein